LNTSELKLVYEEISKELQLPNSNDIFMEALVQNIIIDRVKELLYNDRDLLMSYLYRLDIPESKVQAATKLSKAVPIHESLGLLIFFRQLERVRTKRRYNPPVLDSEWQG
jgi:hypothetical protein